MLTVFILANQNMRRLFVLGLSVFTLTACSDVNFSSDPINEKGGDGPITPNENQAPIADFSFTPCQKDQVCTFDASASSDDKGIVKYIWDFAGDRHEETAVTKDYTFASADPVVVTLTVEDAEGLTGSITKNISIGISQPENQLPLADLQGSCTNLECQFDASGSSDPDGSIVQYTFSFGDSSANASGTVATTTHTYASANSYTVVLTVTDDKGATATDSLIVNPTEPDSDPENQVPHAIINLAQCTELTCNFSGTSSYDPDGHIVSHAWTFDDGQSASGETPIHAYANSGNYTVTLTVTDDKGATGSATTEVTVTEPEPENQLPLADLQGSCTNLECQFDASGSSDTDGSIVQYTFSFGDSSANASGTVATTTHTYASANSYTVVLTITDDKGATATDSLIVNPTEPEPVNQAPLADFDYNCPDGLLECTFTNNSSDPDGDSLTYSWDYGDNTVSTIGNTTHSHDFPAEGYYIVKLTAFDGELSSSVEKQVHVNVDVIIDPCGNQQLITKTEELTFDADSNNCEWSVNDNLSKLDGYIRARREQINTFSLPDKAVLCDINIDFDIESNQDNFYYDDLLIFVFDDVVLSAPKILEDNWSYSSQDLPLYNWLNIRNEYWHQQDLSNSCLGEEQGYSSCDIPKHDQSYAQGDLRMSFGGEIIQTVMSQDLNRSEHEFKLVVTGDNDDANYYNEMRDCRHSGISFKVEAKYVIPAE